MNFHPSQASWENSSAPCDQEEATFALSRSVLEEGKTRPEQRWMQEIKWLLTSTREKGCGILMHCRRRREHWNQDRINTRAQRRAAEQKGIRQETRQEEVTGEVETARAAALLQPATESRGRESPFAFSPLQKSKTMESGFFVNNWDTPQF